MIKKKLISIEFGPCFNFPKTFDNKPNYAIFPDFNFGQNFHMLDQIMPKQGTIGDGLFYGYLVMKYSDNSEHLKKFSGEYNKVTKTMAQIFARHDLLESAHVKKEFGNVKTLPKIEKVIGPFDATMSKKESKKLLETDPELYLKLPTWPPVKAIEYDIIFVNGKKITKSFDLNQYAMANRFGCIMSAQHPFFKNGISSQREAQY